MNVGLVYRDLLPPMVAAELESLTTRIRAGWLVEHDAEGHHVAITAQTINASGLISAGGDPLQGTATTFARKLRLVYLSNTSAGSEAVGSAVIQQNIATVGSAQGLGSAARAAHPSGVVVLLIGGGGGASVIGQGSVTQMRGLLATVHTESGAGGATDAMALRCDVIGRVSGTGTITNGYGLYINHGSTGITNKFGVFVVDTTARNVLNQAEFSDGTAGAPSIKFASDTDTGIYRYNNNVVGITGGGGVGLTVTANIASVADGSLGAPALAFINEQTNGLFRAGAGVMGIAANILIRSATATTGVAEAEIPDRAKGTGAVFGNLLYIGANSSGNDAAGALGLGRRGTSPLWIWADAAGNARIFAGPPTEDNTTVADTAGTVIGTQTSSRAFKKHIVKRTDYAAMLEAVVATPLFDFRLKSGAFNKTFTGLITEESPTFGMDVDADHPAGKSLDEVTAIGYLFGACKALHARVQALETA